MSSPQQELRHWYRHHGRSLPWRSTRDPYRILLSEVMLQQTQVERVIGYYQAFLEAYPSIYELAEADIESLHRLWKGLGYPSRIERFQATCQSIITVYAGDWPQDPLQLQSLPGIGPYTAAALATFAFAVVTPVVDTNIARVYARRDGLALDKKLLWQHAGQENDRKNPIDYNNALMDLGALVCTAQAPHCPRCPWRQRCQSREDLSLIRMRSNPLRVASPRRVYSPRPPHQRGYQHIVLALVHDQGRYLVARRPAHLPRGGYWELPGGKCESGEDDRQALARELLEETGLELLSARPFVTVYDQDAQLPLVLRVYRCRVFHPQRAQALASDALQWVTPQEFLQLDFPPANAPIQERLRDYHRLSK